MQRWQRLPDKSSDLPSFVDTAGTLCPDLPEFDARILAYVMRQEGRGGGLETYGKGDWA